MVLKVGIVGQATKPTPQDLEHGLVLRSIATVSGSHVRLVGPRDADLTLVYPYARPFNSTLTGVLAESGLRAARKTLGRESSEAWLRRVYRLPRRARLLAVSHENLDRRPWQTFGNAIRDAGIPRLTFWPQEIDPSGFRLPYWWNYVDWPDIHRGEARKWSRFGSLYKIDDLCSGKKFGSSFHQRKRAAVWVTRHLEFPRQGILDTMRKYIDVDVVTGIPWGQKERVLSQYQYCVSAENSTGYGYETEKVPEAWVSGCLPIGYSRNPFSDFDEASVFFEPPTECPSELPPLLRGRPSLAGLFAYLAEVLG